MLHPEARGDTGNAGPVSRRHLVFHSLWILCICLDFKDGRKGRQLLIAEFSGACSILCPQRVRLVCARRPSLQEVSLASGTLPTRVAPAPEGRRWSPAPPRRLFWLFRAPHPCEGRAGPPTTGRSPTYRSQAPLVSVCV